MMMWRGIAFAACALVPALAFANGDADEPEPLIWTGENVETCGWPTVVAVSGGGLCTGTLVAPNLVVYAAHCGASGKKVRFSEDNITGKALTPEFCMTNPGYTFQGNDWAFCKLGENVPLPVTPVVFGCETDILQPGAKIAIIGFGANNDVGGAGTKRWSMTTLLGVNWGQNITQIGGNGEASICPGDSGGPTMIQYPDGSWHAFGIASTYNGTCGSGGIHALMPGAVEWIEAESGVDMTPCHDADGKWNPTPLCQGFYAGDETGTGTGTWTDWCEGTPAGKSSATCGAGFDAVPDPDPPQVQITYPTDGQEFDSGSTLDILVDAVDVGWGVKTVAMKIQGNLQPGADEAVPYEFQNVQFPDGTWELVAVGEDWAGNITESEPVKIGIGGPVEEDPDTGGDTGDGSGGDTSGGTEGGDGADDSGDGGTGGTGDPGGSVDEGGCGCATDSGRGRAPGVLAVALFGLLASTRRRRRR